METSDRSCFAAAISYLARFARSKKQLTAYLMRKGFGPPEISSTLEQLEAKGYINDESYARSLIRKRIDRCDGPLKIKQDLFQKGIERNAADGMLREEYPLELQLEKAAKALKKRAKLQASAEKIRAMRFLASRGFSRYVISLCLRDFYEKRGR